MRGKDEGKGMQKAVREAIRMDLEKVNIQCPRLHNESFS